MEDKVLMFGFTPFNDRHQLNVSSKIEISKALGFSFGKWTRKNIHIGGKIGWGYYNYTVFS